MRKLSLLLFIIPVLFACEGSGKKKADQVDTMIEARQIVAYTNDAIDYLNVSSEWMRTNRNKIDSLLQCVRSNSESREGIVLEPIINSFLKGGNSLSDSLAISEEEQSVLRQAMSEYSTHYTAMRTNLKALNKYLKAKEYEFDNYEEGQMMTDSIQYYLNYLASSKRLLSKKIEEVADKASTIIMESHPLKAPIESLRAEMKNFDDLYEAFYAYNLGKMEAQQVDSVFQLVATSVAKGRTTHAILMNGNRKAAYYNSFYAGCDTALNTFEEALTLIRDGKKLPDNTFDQFNKNLNLIVDSYNKFVE